MVVICPEGATTLYVKKQLLASAGMLQSEQHALLPPGRVFQLQGLSKLLQQLTSSSSSSGVATPECLGALSLKLSCAEFCVQTIPAHSDPIMQQCTSSSCSSWFAIPEFAFGSWADAELR